MPVIILISTLCQGIRSRIGSRIHGCIDIERRLVRCQTSCHGQGGSRWCFQYVLQQLESWQILQGLNWSVFFGYSTPGCFSYNPFSLHGRVVRKGVFARSQITGPESYQNKDAKTLTVKKVITLYLGLCSMHMSGASLLSPFPQIAFSGAENILSTCDLEQGLHIL